MKDKITLWWSVCLIVIGVMTIINSIFDHPALHRIIGILDLVLLPIFVFLTVKKLIVITKEAKK